MEQDFEIVKCAVKYYVLYLNKLQRVQEIGPFKSYTDAEEKTYDIDDKIDTGEFVIARRLEEI